MTSEESGRKALDLPGEVVAAVMDVYKIYKTGELETVALRGVSLNIREGEVLAVVGPSGAGKSTLLGVLGGVLRPTAGAVYWSACDGDVSKLNPEKVIEVRRRFMGFVFQEGNLLPHFTALENVELSARIAGLPKPRERAKHLLERVGLSDRLGFVPGRLSTGQRQRVAIAGALINEPKIVLADEPTGNVDIATGEEILELFKELNRETDVSFFIVTHSQQVASFANKILEIMDGVLVGLHGRGADVRHLDKSRMLSLDSLNRLPIPRRLLDQLGNPDGFQVRMEGGEIVLTPPSKEDDVSTFMCKVCGKALKRRRRKCPNCGAAL